MYQHPSSEVFLSIREDVSSNDANHDLMLVCDEGIVQTNKSLLGLHSPLLRRIFGDMTSNSDVDMVILPDLKKATVAEMLKILSLKWSEADCWGLDVVNLLHDLNVTIVFNSANDANHKNEEHSKNNHKIELSGTKNTVKIAASGVLNEEEVVPSEKKIHEFTAKAATKHEAKCPKCPRTFSGTKVKDLLKCHVGLIHFHNEVVSEIQTYFNNSNNCRDCGKVYTTQSSRKKHLVFNHSKYVQQVMTVVNQSFEGPAVSESHQEEAEFPTIKKLFEFSCSFNNCVKHWESKDNSVSSLYYIKSHLLTHFSGKFSLYQKEYFKNKMCTKCNSVNTLYANLYLQNKHLFEKHNILSEEIQETFEGIVKPQRHSHSIPSQDQKDSGKESAATDFEQQQVHRMETAKAEDLIDVSRKTNNPNSDSGESETGKLNRSGAAAEVNDQEAQVDVDSVDSLLYSDDEDDGKSNMEEESGSPDQEHDEDTEDIQKMLLEDNSDSDSDDDDDSIDQRVSADFENEDFVDFGNQAEMPNGDADNEDVIEKVENSRVELKGDLRKDENSGEFNKSNMGKLEDDDVQQELLRLQDMSDDEDEEDDSNISGGQEDQMDASPSDSDHLDNEILQQKLWGDQDFSSDEEDDENMSDEGDK